MLSGERHSSVCCLKSGVYTPLPTFFNEDEELNLEEYEKHLILPVCAGSLGEAVHLSRDERATLIRCTRQALDKQGFESVPIVAGVGGSSTRETVQLARDAASAGAAVGMVIPPAYYAATLQQDSSQIEQYYIDICRLSPIPLLLYNFPANSAGQDLSAKSIIRIIENSPNLCGLKLTCPGRMDKLEQVTASVKTNPEFLILDGVMHDLPAWKEFGGHGTVSGISNIAPSSTVRLWNLCFVENPSLEQQKELREVLNVLSKVDAVVMPLGVRGLKYVLGYVHGYGRGPRRPLLALDEINGKAVTDVLDELLILENRYEEEVMTPESWTTA
ncbi:putative dihydrodipicolinate synthase [Aureobasidium pullulans]|uniref:Dihydrodipicolinate synthase n=1 Tax=Aureobasidium pullulans TaxID=5580 RepID=A0A4S8W087_AURPU|nr:putative dihydrodipicolinate synthase [Aureobasidium pullulans]THW27281.1 putative dihydrodipicolinate synthase [Aureobasidium pullulans]THW56642.1 putative dihydrodipicolinate synthase [Aureobasidium pullulans]THY70046.1 putative dihydrodipicolinate synthase [Aureobasidium pullulans]THZ35431.1 putative dihydrodipicolinate synthase [Aureobasidium pullulans]